MKRAFLLLAVVAFVYSCDRYPDPSTKTVRAYSFYFTPQQRSSYFGGELVSDSVTLHVTNNLTSSNDSVRVEFEVVSGGGVSTVASAYTNKNGDAITSWRLGNDCFEQKLRAKSYDIKGNFLNSSDLVEYSFRNDDWNPMPTGNSYYMVDIAADTVNKITLMISSGTLYKQGERYYQWEPVAGPWTTTLTRVNIDSKGIFYVSTNTGALFKSSNHGVTWVSCSSPYVSGSYYIMISNDNSLWVYSNGNPTRHSVDQGSTWINSGKGFTFNGYGEVYKLKDGSLLLQGDTCCSLYRSFDDGKNWSAVDVPGRPVKLFVNEKDEIFIITQLSGLYLYKSTDNCASFTYLYAVMPDSWGYEMDNVFNKWGKSYYVVIPGWGVLNSPDMIHFDIYWINKNIKSLFIDHNGVLIAQDFDMKTIYYRKNSN